MALYDEWQAAENKIMPKQYWMNERADLFKTTYDEVNLDGQPVEDYNKLVYMIKINQTVQARNFAKELDIQANTVLRKNGDTILHICAEYGQVKLFEHFHKVLKGNLDIQNRLLETPFIMAARES